MTDPHLKYVGPLRDEPDNAGRTRKTVLGRIPMAFLVVVVVPTLLAAIYYLFIVTPRYVSEARFVVRAAAQEQPSSLGLALQSAGVTPSSTDAFVVHEWIVSRDAYTFLGKRYDLPKILAPTRADVLSKPDPASREALYNGFKKRVTVGYDGASAISTLRVEAFTANDAQSLANSLLDGGEGLVNELNERSSSRAVSEAQEAVEAAEARWRGLQARMVSYRNREGIIDPESSAREGATLIGGLLATVANLKAERAQLASQAPQSPQLPLIDARIVAFERQIGLERDKIAGSANSLATKVGGYEGLAAEMALAEKSLAGARTAADGAASDARRQKLYLERVVAPNLPDVASQPKRWLSILSVLGSALMIYGIGWLVWAGLREHRQL